MPVHPQSHLTIDGPYGVAIPLRSAARMPRRRKTPDAVWGHRRKRLHGGSAHWKDIAIGRKPIGLFAGRFFVLRRVAVVEHLHLDAARGQLARLNRFQCHQRRPEKNTGITPRRQMPPLERKLQVTYFCLGADHAHRLSAAVHAAIFPHPCFRQAIHRHKV